MLHIKIGANFVYTYIGQVLYLYIHATIDYLPLIAAECDSAARATSSRNVSILVLYIYLSHCLSYYDY